MVEMEIDRNRTYYPIAVMERLHNLYEIIIQ